MDVTDDLPYRAEYAKSNRSACKGCKQKIDKDHLRLAVMVQSSMFDGKVPNWYHVSCFFAKLRPKSAGDFSHFESLRWEDQEALRKRVDSTGAGGSSSASKNATNGTAKQSKRKSSNQNLKDYTIEYSKSSRAMCRGCEDKIVKGDIRAGKKDYDSEEARRFGGIFLWHHFECFVKLRADLEFFDSGNKLPGFKLLSKEDQDKVKSSLPIMKVVKSEEGEKPEKKPKLDDEVVQRQNKLIFKFRDQLKILPKKELTLLLEYNNQSIPSGNDKMLDRLADIMAFGALLRCGECKNGQLVFRSGVGYFCLGNIDEWTKCEAVTLEPKRKPFKIPSELKEKYDFLNQYVYKPGVKVLQNIQPSASTLLKSYESGKSVKSDAGSRPKVERNAPFRNMEFCIVGKLSKNKDEMKLEIMRLGGRLGTRIHNRTAAVITTQKTVENKGINIKQAEELDIQVVPESIIEECKNTNDGVAAIIKLNMAPWGSDPSKRLIPAEEFKSSGKSRSAFKSNVTSQRLVVKDGTAVDPESGLSDVAHVYKDGRDVYSAALSLTDLQTGKNSFYKLQLLESDNKRSYWLFRAWGRIGTTIGNNKLDSGGREEMINLFKSLFEEKTANMWDNRNHFVKVPGKMVMIDISYEDEDTVDAGNAEISSKLLKPVADLVTMIFNISVMKNVMKELTLDLEKMPLGKLSKKQIEEAFRVLTNAQNCITQAEGSANAKLIVSFTNQFFTLIPHDFGVQNPPLLDNLELIKEKVDMLEALMEIEIAYSMLKSSRDGDKGLNPVDIHYNKLKAEIQVLDKLSAEFKTIELYVQNTHAATHRNYSLEIEQVFKVIRQGEEKRYKPFKKLHNRKLLWHGSRLTNYASIISQGLRIAPPEAPVTGYMFGKGIYFADMVSKSANYCMTSPANNVGLLMLCEVALGDMHELLNAENITKLPKGKHSVKGIGKTQPDPKDMVMLDDGVEVPLGKGIPAPHNNTALLYNEYIVYDVAQVKIRYLLQTRFNYSY